jgi:hypothetical protein
MARNRKTQSAAVRFGPALKALVICLLIGGSGVGYVWQQNQLHELGGQKKRREIRLDELRLQNSQLARHLVELRSPKAVQVKVRDLNLGLAMPQLTQIVRLVDSLPALPSKSLNTLERRYARRETNVGAP